MKFSERIEIVKPNNATQIKGLGKPIGPSVLLLQINNNGLKTGPAKAIHSDPVPPSQEARWVTGAIHKHRSFFALNFSLAFPSSALSFAAHWHIIARVRVYILHRRWFFLARKVVFRPSMDVGPVSFVDVPEKMKPWFKKRQTSTKRFAAHIFMVMCPVKNFVWWSMSQPK